MQRTPAGLPAQLGVAVLAVAAGLLARWLVARWIGHQLPYLTLFPAVITAALLGGWRAGAAATALSALAAMFLLEPLGDVRVARPGDLVGLILFVLTCGYITWVAEWTRAARARERAALSAKRDSDERLRVSLEHIGDGFAALDREWRIVYINRAGAALVGRDAADLIGRNHWEAFPESVGTEIEASYRRAVAGGKPTQLTTYYPPLASWFEIDAYPTPDGLSLFFRNVTERRAAEEERARLLAAERVARADAERASRIKDEFLATLSHELRTPLNAILGWAQLLRRTDQNTAEDLSEGLTTIERNARAQTQLIEDLLDMSRVVAGQLRLDVQSIDLVGVIEGALRTVWPAADAKGVRLERVLDPRAGPVSGDPARLQQVVWNLLSNAIKFTPKGGRVQVVLSRVNSHVEIAVADTGEGIAAEFVPHVFERFRQADPTTTRRHGGLGLGLAIVKNLVEMHGGSVRAQSPGPGRGSTFTVMLPLAVVHRPGADGDNGGGGRDHPQAPGECEFDANVDLPSLSGVKVLVIDDEPDARTLIARVLGACGAEVVTVESAVRGLATIPGARPDVIVCDIGMPDVDGYEFVRRLRGMSGEVGRIPAVALTAFARSEDRTRALRAGYLVHVAKPVEPSELAATVASVAGRTGVEGSAQQP